MNAALRLTEWIDNPVILINANIDALMARNPALPAWAAHQICGWDWAEAGQSETDEEYIDQARAEIEYAHSEGAHQ